MTYTHRDIKRAIKVIKENECTKCVYNNNGKCVDNQCSYYIALRALERVMDLSLHD